jgi:hypothetical protein
MSTQKEIVRSAYEAWWGATEAAIAAVLDSGERELSRILHLAYERSIGRTPPGERVSVLFEMAAPADYLSANRMIRDWIVDRVIAEARRVEADAVVEMGSGWGYNLFNFHARGGPRIPLYACEFTEAGRRCAAMVRDAALAPALTILPFDYYELDFSGLPGAHKRVLVFSSHSIEQIETLPETFFTRLLALGEQVAGMHFEPVGWQFSDLPAPPATQGARAHAERHKYNTNLWTLTQEAERDGRVRVLDRRRDVMAAKVYNPTSLLHWVGASRA